MGRRRLSLDGAVGMRSIAMSVIDSTGSFSGRLGGGIA